MSVFTPREMLLKQAPMLESVLPTLPVADYYWVADMTTPEATCLAVMSSPDVMVLYWADRKDPVRWTAMVQPAQDTQSKLVKSNPFLLMLAENAGIQPAAFLSMLLELIRYSRR